MRGFMKLHYMKEFDGNTENLPESELPDNAVKFREPENMNHLALMLNAAAVVFLILLSAAAAWRLAGSDHPFISFGGLGSFCIGLILSQLVLFPHELLHAVCFQNDVYLYTCFKKGMLFVVGPEPMSKGRFIFMSLLPNIVFGLIPFLAGMIWPYLQILLWFGVFNLAAGAGDYLNVFNALIQMPKGALTQISKMNSWWYLPSEQK